MRYALVFLLLAFSFADDFITQVEYGKELYAHPRGISCKACHGDMGEGKVIATYINKNGKQILQTLPINNISYKSFEKRVKEGKGYMPNYNLTDDEIKAIYAYITQETKKE